MEKENKMGTEKVSRLLLSMGIPVMISMVLQAMYNIVDSMFVARMPDTGGIAHSGELAVNALTLAFPVQMLIVAFGIGTGVGVGARLSRMLGQKKTEEAGRTAGNGIFMALLITAAFMIFGLTGTRAYLAIQTADQTVLDMGTGYLQICTILCAGNVLYGIYEKLLQSTGKTIVNFDGKQFTNNISDPEIEKAENLMAEMHSLNLYDPNWYGNFPDTGNILFYGMGDWALGASNAKNPDADIMVVPFPKSPDADEYYLCGNFAAKMLVKNSTRGDAVATYILCERLAATQEDYLAAAKEKALIPNTSASGVVLSYITEEQYDAIESYKADTTTVFDFGYGMGSTMYGDGEYTYETRGIMNNLMDALLTYDEVDSWAVLRDNWSAAIDDVLKTYNAALS